MGRVCHQSLCADVSKGEYSGSPVAIKRLRVNVGGCNSRVFKVNSIDSVRTCFLNLLPAVMSGGYRMETFDPSKRLAFARGFYGRKPLQYSHRLDTWWEHRAVCKIQPRGKSFAVGERVHHVPATVRLLIDRN